MKNNNVINALEACKEVLVSELMKYIESMPDKKTECWIPLPIYIDDTYGLDGYWSQNTVTEIFIDKETGILMAEFEDYEEQYQEPINECFVVGEIASIIDHLK